jgi:RNA polymerase sigma-70 factor (sigma-E family)
VNGDFDPGFEDFARRRAGALLKTAFLLVGHRDDAEELVQVALLRTAQHWRGASASPEAYIRRVLVHLATDRWRRLGRRPVETVLPHGLDAMATGDPVAQLLDRTILVEALRELPARQRAVVVLRFFEGLSVPETADVLECSEGTVKSYSSRAFARLRLVLPVESSEVWCAD